MAPWRTPEGKSASWLALIAFLVLAPLFAGTAAASGTGSAFFASWQTWISTGGYLPWNVLVFEPKSVLFALVVAVAIGVWMWRLFGGTMSGIPTGGPKATGHGEYGTARWRSASELSRGLGLWQPNSGVSGVLVARAGRKSAWVQNRDEHTLAIGSTGSGKTRRVILPSIYVIGSARKESMILTDPKGELYAHTADWLKSQGYEVVRIDLREPSRGQRWNPMAPVLEAMKQGRFDQAASAARDIAHAITFSDESASKMEPIWTQSQSALITATILGVAQGTPPGLQPNKMWPREDERHMASVYATILSGGEHGKLMDQWINLFPQSHPAYRAYGPVKLSSDKTRDSILTVTAASLSIWADADVAWLTSAHDADLADPGRNPTAVFLVVPDEKATRYTLATLYLQQTMQALVALADQNGGKLPVKVNFLLDEFANLPPIKDFDHTVTVARGRGIRLLLAIQDFAQLKARYGDSAGTIKGNCGTWLYLLTADNDTAAEIEKRLGQYTTEQQRSGSFYTGSHTQGQPALMGRSLLDAAEITKLPDNQVILLQARYSPARLTLPDISKWKPLFAEVAQPVSDGQPGWMGEVEVWSLLPRPDESADDIDPAILEEGY